MIQVAQDEDKREILRQYRKLLRYAKPFLKEGDARQIKKAFNLSMDAHHNMRRRSGEPYIMHPLAVAQICVEEIGLGTTSIVSALLHDVVEDTELEIEDIERNFGSKVAKIIDGLTKISGVFDYGTSMQAENFRKMLLTMSEDVRVILVKIADRLHNMRTLDSMPRNKQIKIASETIFLYAPLSHRLGLYLIKSELEDLYLKYTEPEMYRLIIDKISATKSARTRFIRNFINPIQNELNKRGYEYVIKGRPKSVYSIWTKMQKQDIPFEQVYDLFAVRIIIDVPQENEKAACWQVYSIVTDHYQPNPDRLRDWISTPKSNGYESLHTTVMSKTGNWVEVQIRTRRMDEIAEKGYAAHWKYKHQGPQAIGAESGIELWVARVREMLEHNASSAIEFVDDFRSNLFSDEVFVFTPKGELKKLPNGATALDFAFDIHSEVGARCIGAKVNSKLVPINYKLKTGDQIEILTSSKQKPSEDWLQFVVSSKAKGKIKDVLKEQKKAAANEGKAIVKRKLKQIKQELNNEIVDKLVNFFNVSSPLDLYFKIGTGSIDPKNIKKIKNLDQKVTKKVNGQADVKTGQKIVKTQSKENDVLLIGEDLDEVEYTLAKCCTPIPGDDVFGFVSTHEGIKVHRVNCPNAVELLSKHGNRVIKAKWASKSALSFLAGLSIKGTDRVGLLNDVTRIISNDLQVNIRSITTATEAGIFEGQIQLFVHDTKELDVLIKRIEKIEGMEKVDRFYPK
ncbi:MAG: bifunctional (p)ppGpp synthetase/guanosine-3',5'-bis(diphosphate) 3'-pyrophosphohydrolase [Cyclobacteriaceae bacterium]|nr:bifunctional (p)ppGpp synthetase/guanosine-3',5'-bis(diphosphate) 3'-pyrophosphohydrolase [Cyclobacteriaceae bacterium]